MYYFMPEQEENRRPIFTATQRRIVGFTGTYLALAVSVVLFVGTFVYLGKILAYFSSVLWPLAAAGIVALVLRPVVAGIEKKLHLSRPLSVTVLYIVFALFIGLLSYIIIPPIITELIDFIRYLPDLIERTLRMFRENAPLWMDSLREYVQDPRFDQAVANLTASAQTELSEMLDALTPTLKSAGAGTIGIAAFVVQLAIVPIYLFFFLLFKGDPCSRIAKELLFLKPSLRENILFLVNEFINIIVAFFRGQMVVCLIVGALMAAGFSMVGLRFGLTIGLMIGALNLIPYLGSTIGFITILAVSYVQPGGGFPLLLLSVGVFAAVQFIEGWFITPFVMGNRTGLHPLVIIIAIFFWGTAFNSLIGVMFAIPLTAFFVTAWRFVRQKYLSDPEPAKHLTSSISPNKP